MAKINKITLEGISYDIVDTESRDLINETKEDLRKEINSKQDTLISGNNIKTVNGLSLVGSGNIDLGNLSGSSSADAAPIASTLNFTTTVDNVVLEGNTLGGESIEVEIPAVTTENAGVMSAEDKEKLDSIKIINNLTTGGADKALSAEMGKELKNMAIIGGKYNQFIVGGHITNWGGASGYLYIDLIYKNAEIVSSLKTSGIRVRYKLDDTISTAYYWQSMSGTKSGVEELSSVNMSSNLGKLSLIVNWDALFDGFNKVLEDPIIIPATFFNENPIPSIHEDINEIRDNIESLENEVEVISNSVLISEIRAIDVKVDVAANYITSPLPDILPAGTVINSVGYKGGNFYFYNSSNKLIKPVVSSAVVPYTLTEDAHFVGGGVAGTISYSYNKEVFVSTVRPKVNIYSSDSQVEILDKMLHAIEQGNTDVHFQSSTYILDSVYIHMRDVLGESAGFKSNHFGLPIGNGCKYYLHGSTIISKAPQEEYTNVRNIFDTMLILGDLEMHDGILINEGGTYCIHDEHGQSKTPYIHKYYNIIAKYVLTGDDVAGPKPFGCGTGYNASLCFDTCAFLSESTKDTVFALHGPVGNTDTPVNLNMFVKNCFFEKYSIQVNTSTIVNSRDNSSIVYCGNQHKYTPAFTAFNQVIEYNNSTI